MEDVKVIERALEQMVMGERTPAELLGLGAEVIAGLYAVGLDAFDRGDHARADAVFQRCVMFEPQNADYWTALGAVRQALERFDEAAEIYQIAAVMTEDPAPAAFAALCLARAGQAGRARVLARDVLDRAGSRPDAPWFSALVRVAQCREVVS